MFGWIKYLMFGQFNSIKYQPVSPYKRKLAVVYAISSWTLFSFVVYSLAKEKLTKLNESVDYVKILRMKDSVIVKKFSGLKQVHEYEIDLNGKESEGSVIVQNSRHEQLNHK